MGKYSLLCGTSDKCGNKKNLVVFKNWMTRECNKGSSQDFVI